MKRKQPKKQSIDSNLVSSFKTLTIWDLLQRRLLFTMQIHVGPITGLVTSMSSWWAGEGTRENPILTVSHPPTQLIGICMSILVVLQKSPVRVVAEWLPGANNDYDAAEMLPVKSSAYLAIAKVNMQSVQHVGIKLEYRKRKLIEVLVRRWSNALTEPSVNKGYRGKHLVIWKHAFCSRVRLSHKPNKTYLKGRT